MKYFKTLAPGLLLCGLALPGTAQFSISTVAGTDRVRDGSPANTAPLRTPECVLTDAAGNLYFADLDDDRIRKVSPAGIISTVAGSGIMGFSGDGSSATAAALDGVTGIALDASGNLYLADHGNYRVRKVTPSGVISTVAGNGKNVYAGDGVAATATAVDAYALVVDAAGNLYVSDHLNYRIRKIDGTTGIISTIAGNGTKGSGGDGRAATSAQIGEVTGLALDASGNLYLADFENSYVRKVTPDGIISTVAGSGYYSYFGDGRPALQAGLDPYAITLDANGNLYIADNWNDRVRKVAAGTGVITTVAGNGGYGYSGDSRLAVSASLASPAGVALDGAGNLYIADEYNGRVRKVDGSGTISTVAGTDVKDGGPAARAYLNFPAGVAVDAAGNTYIADTSHHRVRKVDTAGTISTLAGTGVPGDLGSSGLGIQMPLSGPEQVAVDAQGNVYVADSNNHRVRKITPDGYLTTVAGTGKPGYSGDGAAATSAQIDYPEGLAVDAAGNLYFTDLGNFHIRKVAPDGTISTVAGNGSTTFSGDGGPAGQAGMLPMDVAADGQGNLYVADMAANRIRKIDATTGIITTVAGTGQAGFGGDGGPASKAKLDNPTAVALDAAGNLLLTDSFNFAVRRVDKSGTIVTVAGSGWPLFDGDGQAALDAGLSPAHLAADASGRVYVADLVNDRIRRLALVVPASASVSAGDGQAAVVGTQLPAALAVKVTDASGAPVPGVAVTFAVAAGDATLSPATATTGADGTASTVVKLGNTPGAVTVTATVTGLPAATFKLTAQPAVSPAAPRITPGGVVGSGLSLPSVTTMSPNALLSVFGENFAAAGTLRLLSASDVAGGSVPTMLEGVCVLVNGAPTPISAVLPGQINFQAPQAPSGSVASVQVATGCGTAAEIRSAAVQIPVWDAAPEFFYFTAATGGHSPIAAVDAITGGRIGASGLIPGLAFTPAKPGDFLALFFTGGGLTTPPVRPGEISSQTASVAGAVTLTVGGISIDLAANAYVGAAPGYPGLYQLNFQMPASVPDGDQPVILTIAGHASPAQGILTVQR